MIYLSKLLFYPFLQRIKPFLLPDSELEELKKNTWKSNTNTACITLKSHYFKILSGWVSVYLELDSENSVTPQVSIDFGEGYSKINLSDMHKIDKNTYQIEFMLPTTPKNISLYITSMGESIFSIKSLEVRTHSKVLHIIKQVLSIVKHDYKSGAKPFRIYKKSYIRYKNHSLDVMFEQLEEEYKKIHPYSIQGTKRRKTSYVRWIEDNENNNEVYVQDKFNYMPLISVVMATYNTSDQYLKKAIDSVLDQSYPNWELCIADDASSNSKTIEILKFYEKEYDNIKVIYREKNGHISEATNSALTLARGEFVAFLDHDDMLSKNALLEVNKVINKSPKVKLIYSDEDKVDSKGKRYEPHFKSGWNPDMFYSQNYISHLSVIKRELIKKVGGLRCGYEGAQDYDLLLRVLDGVKENEIAHIEKILYHWRAIPGSTAFGAKEKAYTSDAGLKALTDYFQKKDKHIVVEQGKVANTYKVSYPLPEELPLVTILIPTRDGFDILSKCVESILAYTTYKNYEILILDNETTDTRTLEYFEELKKYKNISIIEYYKPFNYSAINNFGVKHAKGDIITLLNNDTEIITEGWLGEMVRHALRPDIGAIGPMLYYGNDTIQHAGVVLGIGGVAGHSHKSMKKGTFGYFSRLKIVQNYSAVTGACLVVRKELYEKVGGLNEKELSVAFNDVDLCLKFLKEGKRNLWTPHVELYHHESVSRGREDTKVKKIRFNAETLYMKKNWKHELKNDQYYNSNLSRINTDFRPNSETKVISKELSNLSDMRALNKKYKRQLKKKIFFTSHKNKKKNRDALQKINRIPKSFIRIFDQESYVSANIDVQKNIENNKFMNGLEHFILFGYTEVREGKRRIGTQFPFFTEREYGKHNKDIVLHVEEGVFSSVFEYFIEFGYEEFLSKKRNLFGTYPFVWTESLRNHVESYFDESAYLEVNTDVKLSIERNEFLDGWEHFILIGAEEVRRGNRMLHPKIGKMRETLYAQLNQDIFDIEKYGSMSYPFEHFLTYGAQEMIAGERIVSVSELYKYVVPRRTNEIEKRINHFSNKPRISIIMPVYNVDAVWLVFAIESLKKQWYTNWELCIANDASDKKETLEVLASLDDARIKIVHLKKNVNISGASNEALKMATGEYIALMDNDDELTPDALYEMVKVINESNADFIYSDEDKIEGNGEYSDPHFKPDFSPDMFLSQNYISHFTMIKRVLVNEVGGWTVGLEGSQDYDLYLKVLELTNHIVHIPKVLYHWRKVSGSTAVEFSAKSYAQVAGKKALENAMLRRGIEGKVQDGKYPGTYRIKYNIRKNSLISIVIPFKDKPELLDTCINSILDKSTYQNYEIIGINNNSENVETFEMMKKLETKDSRVSFYEYNIPFNYSKINNYAVKKYAKGEHVILLNNDIEIISEAWIESLLEFSQRDDVGAVGAKLYYPDDTIQHAGVTMGVLTLAGHNFRHLPREATGYMGRESVIQNVTAVTAACLMIKKDIYLSMNGLNAKNLKIAFNDIDFCLRIREEGYINVYTPYCEMYHHESISRGKENTSDKLKRFNKELDYMQERHSAILGEGDPYYNPNFTLESEDFSFEL